MAVWLAVCCFHARPVLQIAGRILGAAGSQFVKEDCRASVQ